MSRRNAVSSSASAPATELMLPAGGVSSKPKTHQMRRFRVAVAVLLALGIASLGVAIGLSIGGRAQPSPGDWSAWRPPDGGLAGAQEIADYVAPYYRADPSTQLAVVTPVHLND